MTRLLLSLLLAQAEPGRAREVVHDATRSIEVRPAVSTPDRHVTCVVTFPEESIDTLVAAWNESDLSIERKRDHLFLKLFRAAEGDLHVLGSSGTLYRLYIRPAPGEPDGQVRIVRPAEAAERAPGALDLIRAMRLARPTESMAVRAAGGDPVFAAGALSARVRWTYETPHHVGHVLELTNTGPRPLHVDPRRLAGDGLLLAGVREPVVPARGSTCLYLVFWR